MLSSRFDRVDPSSVDTAVSKKVCKPYNVSFDRIKCSGEQMSEVVRKNFTGRNVSSFAKCFHISPNVASV
jgi:hypothetical protein